MPHSLPIPRAFSPHRDAHNDTRRELFGPPRRPAESMALTALVLIVLTVASSVGAILIASTVSGAGHGDSDAADSWAGLGVLIMAALIGACTVPIAATLILRLLRVPRAGTALLATIVTVLADARGPQLVFGASGASVFDSYLIAIALAAAWVGALHPHVLRHVFRRR